MSWLTRLFSRRRLYGDLSAEIEEHLNEKIDELVAGGVPSEEATRTARREFGNVMLLAERSREVWQWPTVESFFADVRFALRMLRKSPSFTAVAVLTLALGIGANTAIFSVVYTSLLRPLPFPDSHQLVDVGGHSSLIDFPKLLVSFPDIEDIRAQNTVFSGIAPYTYSTMTLTGSGAPQQLDSAKVSAEFFPLLGMKPLYGRVFTPVEMQPGQDREVILSYQLWQKQFGSDVHALGKSITLDGNAYTIIGVMPPQQHLGYANDEKLWTPFAPPKEERAARNNRSALVVARLEPGCTVKQAQAELDAIATRLANAYPDAGKTRSFRAVSLQSSIVGDARLPLLILLCAVGFVLLIACANVGNLFLSRGWARRRELAIRSMLGATRGRIIRQLLVESLIIALMGGVCGLLLATWGVQGLQSLLPPNTPRVKDLSIDQAVLWFTLGASILAGILFGLSPAVLASGQGLNAVMKEAGAGARAGVAGTRHKFLRQLLVVAEVALALLLVIGATLALRSFARLREVNLGFRPDHLLTMRVNFPSGGLEKPEQFIPYVRQIVDLTRAIPGVQDVAASLYVPLSGSKGVATVQTDATSHGSPSFMTEFNRATPGYFRTLGIPLLAGRDFTDADTSGAPAVIIVNQAFAETLFGSANPIGKRIGKDQIVGEIENFRDQATKDAPGPYLFFPYDQAEQAGGISLVMRTKTDPLAVISAVQDRIWSINKAQPIDDVESMDQLVSRSNAAPRFQTFLLGIFGALGLLLALVGIYGVISYSVTQRTHEIGIRVALGAKQQDVMRLVLGQAAKLTLIGVAIGIGAALALTRLMGSILYDVKVTDPITFVSVAILLTIVAMAACYIPARRAMRVDPMVALRYE